MNLNHRVISYKINVFVWAYVCMFVHTYTAAAYEQSLFTCYVETFTHADTFFTGK